MKPELLKGSSHTDLRGSIKYNNAFELTAIKRMYIIANADMAFVRGWQGHKVERRWFTAVSGSFFIALKRMDSWESPDKSHEVLSFELHATTLDVLQVPAGYANSIRSLSEGAQLLAMSDYVLGEVADEYRFEYP